MREHYLTIPKHSYRTFFDKLLRREPSKECDGGVYMYTDAKKLQPAYLAIGQSTEFKIKCPGKCGKRISFTIDGFIE